MVVLRAFGLFVSAGLFEIGGGWLVWQWMREHQAVWYAMVGTVVARGRRPLPGRRERDALHAALR